MYVYENSGCSRTRYFGRWFPKGFRRGASRISQNFLTDSHLGADAAISLGAPVGVRGDTPTLKAIEPPPSAPPTPRRYAGGRREARPTHPSLVADGRHPPRERRVSGSDGYVWICRCDRPADHHRISKWILCEHLFMLTNKMSEQGCYVENVIVWAVMADILAVMIYGWYRMAKDGE
jgi:hypothetical protein